MAEAANRASDGDRGEPIEAGPFLAWLGQVRDAVDGVADAEVPCGTCTACCSSRQFVLVGPDEHDALAHLPAALLAPAPGAAAGYRVLGYDEHGRCPMLGDHGCTVYDHRPRTCRTYDCRIFPASGVAPTDKPRIAERAARWRFTHPSEADERAHAAVRATAERIGADPAALPPEEQPRTPTHLAIAAVLHAEV